MQLPCQCILFNRLITRDNIQNKAALDNNLGHEQLTFKHAMTFHFLTVLKCDHKASTGPAQPLCRLHSRLVLSPRHSNIDESNYNFFYYAISGTFRHSKPKIFLNQLREKNLSSLCNT